MQQYSATCTAGFFPSGQCESHLKLGVKSEEGPPRDAPIFPAFGAFPNFSIMERGGRGANAANGPSGDGGGGGRRSPRARLPGARMRKESGRQLLLARCFFIFTLLLRSFFLAPLIFPPLSLSAVSPSSVPLGRPRRSGGSGYVRVRHSFLPISPFRSQRISLGPQLSARKGATCTVAKQK